MSYVEVTPYDEATGVLKEEYDAAIGRAGRIWNIVSVQGQLPAVLRESMRLYREVMFGPSPLTRAQRELLAAVTSSANSTRYCTIAHWHDYPRRGRGPGGGRPDHGRLEVGRHG